jgi:hypothetical protein
MSRDTGRRCRAAAVVPLLLALLLFHTCLAWTSQSATRHVSALRLVADVSETRATVELVNPGPRYWLKLGLSNHSPTPFRFDVAVAEIGVARSKRVVQYLGAAWTEEFLLVGLTNAQDIKTHGKYVVVPPRGQRDATDGSFAFMTGRMHARSEAIKELRAITHAIHKGGVGRKVQEVTPGETWTTEFDSIGTKGNVVQELAREAKGKALQLTVTFYQGEQLAYGPVTCELPSLQSLSSGKTIDLSLKTDKSTKGPQE